MNNAMNNAMNMMNNDRFINKANMIVLGVQIDYICILKLITKYFNYGNLFI